MSKCLYNYVTPTASDEIVSIQNTIVVCGVQKKLQKRQNISKKNIKYHQQTIKISFKMNLKKIKTNWKIKRTKKKYKQNKRRFPQKHIYFRFYHASIYIFKRKLFSLYLREHVSAFRLQNNTYIAISITRNHKKRCIFFIFK